MIFYKSKNLAHVRFSFLLCRVFFNEVNQKMCQVNQLFFLKAPDSLHFQHFEQVFESRMLHKKSHETFLFHGFLCNMGTENSRHVCMSGHSIYFCAPASAQSCIPYSETLRYSSVLSASFFASAFLSFPIPPASAWV